MKPPPEDKWPICDICGQSKHISVSKGWEESTLADFYCSTYGCPAAPPGHDKEWEFLNSLFPDKK